MIPFLLFDFDGTIANSMDLGMQIANSLAPRFGIDSISREEFDLMRTMSIPKALKTLKIPFYKLPQAIPLALVEYRHMIHDLHPFEGIHDMLRDLRNLGHRMALLSSNSKENLNHFIIQHDLDFFEWVEGTSGILNKHSSIRKQMRKHGLKPDNLIYVGDEIRDIIAAHKCGIRIISVSWGFHTVDLLASKNPDYLVDNPLQIVQLMRSISS